MDEVSISDLCYTTYPCKHYVSIHGERFLMSGIDIYKLQKRLIGKDSTKGNAHTPKIEILETHPSTRVSF